MKKLFIPFCMVALSITACGDPSHNKQEEKTEINQEEVLELEAATEELEETAKDIEETSLELDSLIENL